MYFLESLSMTCTYGMMIRIILQSSSPGHKAHFCRGITLQKQKKTANHGSRLPHYSKDITCVEARETVQNASNNGRLSEVNAMWMRYDIGTPGPQHVNGGHTTRTSSYICLRNGFQGCKEGDSHVRAACAVENLDFSILP